MEHIQIWVAVNDCGDHAVSLDSAEDAIANLMDEHGGAAVRTAKVSIAMALPIAIESEEIEITDEDGDEAALEIEEEAPELPELLPEEASPKAPAEPAVAA